MAPSPATVSCDLTGEQRESLTQNVMLTRGPNGDRVAMLGDFGLSKRLEDTLDMAKTCIGSPFYMVRASRRGGGRGSSGGNSSSVGRTNLYAWSSPRRCLCLGWLTTWRRLWLWGGGLGVPLSNRALTREPTQAVALLWAPDAASGGREWLAHSAEQKVAENCAA